MNSFVHRRLTRRWALEEGYSAEDAETLGQLTNGVDARKGDLLHPWNWRFHFGPHGAWDTGTAALERAVASAGTPAGLGELAVALHAAQDGVGHGVHGPLTHPLHRDIDVWDARDDETRALVEDLTRRTLRVYRAAVLLEGEREERTVAAADPDG